MSKTSFARLGIPLFVALLLCASTPVRAQQVGDLGTALQGIDATILALGRIVSDENAKVLAEQAAGMIAQGRVANDEAWKLAMQGADFAAQAGIADQLWKKAGEVGDAAANSKARAAQLGRIGEMVTWMGRITDAAAVIDDFKNGNKDFAAYQLALTGAGEVLQLEAAKTALLGVSGTAAATVGAAVFAIGLTLQSFREVRQTARESRDVQFLNHLDRNPAYQQVDQKIRRRKQGESIIKHDDAAIRFFYSEMTGNPRGLVGSYFSDNIDSDWQSKTLAQLEPKIRAILLKANADRLLAEQEVWDRRDAQAAKAKEALDKASQLFAQAIERLRQEDPSKVAANTGRSSTATEATPAEMPPSLRLAFTQLRAALNTLEGVKPRIRVIANDMRQFESEKDVHYLESAKGNSEYVVSILQGAAADAASAAKAHPAAAAVGKRLEGEITNLIVALNATAEQATQKIALAVQQAGQPGQPGTPVPPPEPRAAPPSPSPPPRPVCSKDLPDGTPCDEPASPSYTYDDPSTGCPNGQYAVLDYDRELKKIVRTGCTADRPTEPVAPAVAPTQTAKEEKDDPYARWRQAQAEAVAEAEQKKQAREEERRRKDEQWRTEGFKLPEFKLPEFKLPEMEFAEYQPPDITIVGPQASDSSWGLVLATNPALRQSLSAMYANLGSKLAAIERIKQQLRAVANRMDAAFAKASGNLVGSCDDGKLALLEPGMQKITVGQRELEAFDLEALKKNVATLRVLKNQLQGATSLPPAKYDDLRRRLTVLIAQYNQELGRQSTQRWLKVINDNRQILFSASQWQIATGQAEGIHLSPAEDAQISSECDVLFREVPRIDQLIARRQHILDQEANAAALVRPLLSRLKALRADYEGLAAGKTSVAAARALKEEFHPVPAKANTATPKRAWDLAALWATAAVSVANARMAGEAAEIADQVNEQLEQALQEWGLQVASRLTKTLESTWSDTVFNQITEVANLAGIGGHPDFQPMVQKLAALTSGRKVRPPSGGTATSGQCPFPEPPPGQAGIGLAQAMYQAAQRCVENLQRDVGQIGPNPDADGLALLGRGEAIMSEAGRRAASFAPASAANASRQKMLLTFAQLEKVVAGRIEELKRAPGQTVAQARPHTPGAPSPGVTGTAATSATRATSPIAASDVHPQLASITPSVAARPSADAAQQIIEHALRQLVQSKAELGSLLQTERWESASEDLLDKSELAVEDAQRDLASTSPNSIRAAEPQFKALLSEMRDMLATRRSGAAPPATAAAPGTQSEEIARVREMYQKFVEAYQSKNLSTVVRTMTPEWVASDGLTIDELEDTLRNSFRIFDSISFRIDGLNVNALGGGKFQASYTATLIGRISRQNLKHEESSSVSDVVRMTPDGPRIEKTAGGQVWMN